MSRRSNPTVVGAFVIGALALVVVGTIALGGGRFLERSLPFVTVFPGSVSGLQVGTPVEFRGVRVGRVTRIEAVYDVQATTIIIPVYFELARGAVRPVNAPAGFLGISDEDVMEEMRVLIERGLRARLDVKSLVTGQSVVTLELLPDAPAATSGLETDFFEIPSVPSTLDKVSNMLQSLPLDDLVQKFINTLDEVNALVASGELREIIVNANETVKAARALLANVDTRVTDVSAEAVATLEETRRALAETEQRLAILMTDVRALSQNANARVTTVADSVDVTLGDVGKLARRTDARVDPLADSAVGALDQAKRTFVTADELIDEDSRTRSSLDSALVEIAGAARSLRIFAEYLERHPDALLKGKGY